MPPPSDPRFVEVGEEDSGGSKWKPLDGLPQADTDEFVKIKKNASLVGELEECPSGLVRSRARRPPGGI